MATSQLATSSFLSTKTFNGLRPRLGFSNLSVSVCSSPKSFKAAVVLNATTVAASKYTSIKPLGDRILIKTKIVDEKTVPRSQFRSFSLSPRWSNHRLYLPSASPVAASVTSLDSPSASSTDEDGKKLLLEVKDLTAVIAESGEKILHGVDLSVYEGEVHAIMGKNGSGKSTFAKVLVGHPDYEVTGGIVTYKGENLLNMEAEERSLAGLFLSFQSPVEIPGVSNSDFLNMAYNARRRKLGLPELGPIEFFGHLLSKLNLVNMKPDFLNRNVNVGFSGGEKKRNEILQLAVLEAELAILDEIDSGLDVDALRDVATAVNGLLTPTNSVLMITHYQRLLEYIKPTYIHIMENGRIVKTGDSSLAKVLEKGGYKAISDA